MRINIFLKNIFKMTIGKIGLKVIDRSCDSRIKYLRKQGAQIGDNTVLYCGVSAFGTEPYLVEVGSNCLLAANTRLITHDGGVVVLNNLNYFDGVAMDKIASVKIGSNVYMGVGATVLPGVTIGDNVIVGGGAIVTKDVPSGTVVAGVPARVISTLDEYYEKTKNKNMFYPTFEFTPKQKKEYFMNLNNKCKR